MPDRNHAAAPPGGAAHDEGAKDPTVAVPVAFLRGVADFLADREADFADYARDAMSDVAAADRRREYERSAGLAGAARRLPGDD